MDWTESQRRLGLSARRLLNVANCYHDKQDTVQTISDTGGLDISVLDVARVESLHWASENPNGVQDIEQFDLFTCMIDETATRIIVQYNPEDGKLYGWSAMPRFVLLRNVTLDFDFKAFFLDFKFQYDKKKKCENYDICRLNGGDKEIFYIGVCQFEQYADFHKALELSGKDGITIEAINSFPSVDDIEKQKSIDKAFAEAEATQGPMQHTYKDHCLSTYNLMKMANYLKIPIIQFVADGDSRFRLQMMLVGEFDIKNDEDNFNINSEMLERNIQSLILDALAAGWNIHQPSLSDMFHYFATAEELQIADFVSNAIKKDPYEPFSPDPNTTIHFYLFIRVLSDVFRMIAPIIGELSRSPCQDQCHWLRKTVKISPLSTKLLCFGNYPALFAHIVQVYDLGPEYGLLKSDIDIHNQSDQQSAERIISGNVLDGLKRIPWSEGTVVLILKRGFEAWWKMELTVIDRLCNVYFVSKVMQLWRVYQELCGFDMKETFISQELYRDTLIMCSSLPQLAVAFKLFFQSKPFLPWKFSEYPLEKYHSEIRGGCLAMLTNLV